MAFGGLSDELSGFGVKHYRYWLYITPPEGSYAGYNTAPLKCYPAVLCRVLARAACACGKFSE